MHTARQVVHGKNGVQWSLQEPQSPPASPGLRRRACIQFRTEKLLMAEVDLCLETNFQPTKAPGPEMWGKEAIRRRRRSRPQGL